MKRDAFEIRIGTNGEAKLARSETRSSSDVLISVIAFFCGGFFGGVCGALGFKVVERWLS